MSQDYQVLKTHFDAANECQQRGKTTEAGLLSYAAHLLERLDPPLGGKLLDLGCGDGLPMAMMQRLRPDLQIDGIELSEVLAQKARGNNPQSQIWVGNILEMELSSKDRYHAVFSFSFLQYIAPEDIFPLQARLASLVLGTGGVVLHCSIPDLRMRAVNISEAQFRKHGLQAWLRTPIIFFFQAWKQKNRYGSNGFWLNPHAILKQCASIGFTELLPADVYYRFDFKTRVGN